MNNPSIYFRISKRLFINIVTLWIIVSLSYLIVKLAPGNPYQEEKDVDPIVLEELKEKYDFGYLEYLGGVLQGDFRYSYNNLDRKVSDIISGSIPISLELGAYAMVIAILFGLALGTLSAYKQGRKVDILIMGVAMLGIAVPNFVLGPLLQMIFSEKLEWFKVAGWNGFGQKVLPSITLAAMYVAYISRISRGAVLENLKQDYVKTAMAKGLSQFQIAYRHVLKNCMIPIINFLGPSLAAVLTGTLVVEKIFNIPGLGRYFVESALQRDYPLALGIIITYSVFLLFINLLVDLLQSYIDPRIRFE